MLIQGNNTVEIINDLNQHVNTESSNWKIVKFADKLKDIVCLLIGCTREQLESEEFKNKELGEEWDLYNLKASNGEYFAIHQTKEKLEDYRVDGKTVNYDLVKMTPRHVLQKIGTELFRKQFHEQTWVNATMVDYKYKANFADGCPIDTNECNDETECLAYGIKSCKLPNWIITDTRFLNECQAVKEKGGILIRVNRPPKCPVCGEHDVVLKMGGKVCWGKCGGKIVGPTYTESELHESETALDDFEGFDYEIENVGGLRDLIKDIKNILINEGII